MNLDDYYSIDYVLAKIPITKPALKALAQRGGFVSWTKIGSQWFFKKADVHRYLEDREHTAEESERSFAETAALAREKALRGRR